MSAADLIARAERVLARGGQPNLATLYMERAWVRARSERVVHQINKDVAHRKLPRGGAL